MDNRIARVFVNNVEVGSLPAEQYWEIYKEAKKDWKNYLLQTFNIIKVITKIFALIIWYIPYVWIIAILSIYCFDQAFFTDLFTIIQNNSPQDNASGLITIITLSIYLSTFVVFLALPFMGIRKIGYTDMFGWSINKTIRKLLEVPADGDMTVKFIGNSANHAD